MSKRKPIEHVVDEHGCWNCTSHRPNTHGYPQLWKNGKNHNMHRVLFEEKNGPIGLGLVIRHICDNRSCINIEHMLPGTALENAQDRNSRDRNNPPVGERSGTAKLTEDQIQEIRSSTTGQQALADRFGINQSQVSRIKNRKRWSHV